MSFDNLEYVLLSKFKKFSRSGCKERNFKIRVSVSNKFAFKGKSRVSEALNFFTKMFSFF